MADPASVGTIPAFITALGGAVAGILGAVALFGRRKPSDDAVAPHGVPFDITRDREIESRLSRLEEQAVNTKDRLDNHEEVISLLRAQEVTTEARTPRPSRPSPRKRS